MCLLPLAQRRMVSQSPKLSVHSTFGQLNMFSLFVLQAYHKHKRLAINKNSIKDVGYFNMVLTVN